jgi:hypothetical protein
VVGGWLLAELEILSTLAAVGVGITLLAVALVIIGKYLVLAARLGQMALVVMALVLLVAVGLTAALRQLLAPGVTID